MLDVVTVVDKLAEFNLVRPNKIINGWYSIYCPFHNSGQERRASCGILLADDYRNGVKYPAGYTHCFTCGRASTLEETVSDILKNHSITTSGIEWLKQNIPGYEELAEIEPLISNELLENLTNKYAIKDIQARMSAEPSYISEEELASYRYTVPYMYERRLTDEIIAEYDIGVDLNWIPSGRKNPVPCITFPVKDIEGRTLFICRRSIKGKLYNYPQGINKPVYGIDKLAKGTKSVVICESCINALTAKIYGYEAVALLGTGNAYQVNQLKQLGVEEFVLAMDGDEAGRKASARLKRQLQSVAIVWTINMPDGKDVNDCEKEEFVRLYEERE